MELAQEIMMEVEKPKEPATIYGVPVKRDSLIDQLFIEEPLTKDEELNLMIYMSHFLISYQQSAVRQAIELPAGIPNPTRIIIHHICDKLGLGSFTRGSKGSQKRMVIGMMELAKEKFEKAKNQRDILIYHALNMYRFKTFDPPEVTIQNQVYEVVTEQLENVKNGLDYNESWKKVIVQNDEEMKKYIDSHENEVKKPVKELPKDGRDWTLSDGDFQIYVSGENKEVVNKEAFKNMQSESEFNLNGTEFINPQGAKLPKWEDYGFDTDNIGANQEDEDLDDYYDDIEMGEEANTAETKIDYSKLEDLSQLKLADFHGRPDKIESITVTNITHDSCELEWVIPDSNNSPITQYTIK